MNFSISDDFLYFNATEFSNLRSLSLSKFLNNLFNKTIINNLADEHSLRPIYYQYDDEGSSHLYMRHELMTLLDVTAQDVYNVMIERLVKHAAKLVGLKFNYVSHLDSERSANIKIDSAKYEYSIATHRRQILSHVLDKLQQADVLTDNLIEILKEIDVKEEYNTLIWGSNLIYRFLQKKNSWDINHARQQLIAKIAACSYEIQIRGNFLKVLLAQLFIREMHIRVISSRMRSLE